MPVWWSIAADSGFVTAVADSVAFTMGQTAADRSRWVTSDEAWEDLVWPPVYQRLQDRIGVSKAVSAELQSRLVRELAVRVAQVRWGPDAALELLLNTDPDVAAARQALHNREALLGNPAP